jgi:hypothetical protein
VSITVSRRTMVDIYSENCGSIGYNTNLFATDVDARLYGGVLA